MYFFIIFLRYLLVFFCKIVFCDVSEGGEGILLLELEEVIDWECVVCGLWGILGVGLEVVVLSCELWWGVFEFLYFVLFGFNFLVRGSLLFICDWGVFIGFLIGFLFLGCFIVGNLGGELFFVGVDVLFWRDDGRKLVVVDMNDGNGFLVGCFGIVKVVLFIMDDEFG